MIPFQYVDFYDCTCAIAAKYRGKLLLPQSAFDDELDSQLLYGLFAPGICGNATKGRFVEVLGRSAVTSCCSNPNLNRCALVFLGGGNSMRPASRGWRSKHPQRSR